MKFPVLFLLFSLVASSAETFIGPTTAANRLLVQTNEAIVITASKAQSDEPQRMIAILRGETNEVFIEAVRAQEPYFLSGPAELINDPSDDIAVFTFHRITNSSVHSVFATALTNFFTVTSNQTIHILPPMGEHTYTIQRGTNIVSWDNFSLEMMEFTGPLTIGVSADSSGRATLLSYYFLENGFTLPDKRVLAGPTGTFEIAVEKSTDLKNWSPVVLHQTSDPQRSFYRLRLQP